MELIQEKLNRDYNNKLIYLKATIGVEYIHVKGNLLDTDYSFTIFIHRDESYEKLKHKIDKAIINVYTINNEYDV